MNDSQKCFYERANIYDNEYNQNMNAIKRIVLWKYNIIDESSAYIFCNNGTINSISYEWIQSLSKNYNSILYKIKNFYVNRL